MRTCCFCTITYNNCFTVIHYSNVSVPFPYRKYGPVTNNQTEIEAAIVAMNVLKNEGITMYSTSDYSQRICFLYSFRLQ